MADEQRGPESRPEGSRTERERNTPGLSSSGPIGEPAEGVLTLVCLTCGQEYFFSEQDPPQGMSCEKCGSHVFRDFFTPLENDEAAQDFEDSTARDLDPDDPEVDTMPGDIIDLNRGP